MKTAQIPLSDLRTLEKNIRRHNDKQISEYMRSLKKFGQIRPMVVDELNVILVGNGMFEAMRRLGWETAECKVAEGLSENDKRKLMLADNRIYELGLTDMDAFEEIIAELDGDFDIPGWDDDLLETLQSSMAEATALVESYGVYTPEEVSRVADSSNAATGEAIQPEETGEPLQRPFWSMEQNGQVSDSPQIEPISVAVPAPSGKTVICPHCGVAFALTLDMIGGA